MSDSLAEAQRRVEGMIDVWLDEEGYVPSWLFALHETVTAANVGRQMDSDGQGGSA